MQFVNKTIWVTGASSGIGQEAAIQLSAEAKRLVLSGRNVEQLEAVRKLCFNSDKHLVVPFDLASIDDPTALVEDVWLQSGGIDVLLNSGGISQRSLAMDCVEAVDRRLMEVNFFGTVALTKALVKKLLTKPAVHRGDVITISSVSGKIGAPMRAGYCASKHAVVGYMDCLRAELSDSGVGVAVVSPGWVKTAIAENALDSDGSQYNRKDRDTENGIAVGDFVSTMLKKLKKGRQDIVIAKGKANFGFHFHRFFPELYHRLLKRIYQHQDQ
jgi:short-subunit dehydrogenase